VSHRLVSDGHWSSYKSVTPLGVRRALLQKCHTAWCQTGTGRVTKVSHLGGRRALVELQKCHTAWCQTGTICDTKVSHRLVSDMHLSCHKSGIPGWQRNCSVWIIITMIIIITWPSLIARNNKNMC
jgi:hypothetical protein